MHKSLDVFEAWMCLKVGQIRQPTAEVAALERLKKSQETDFDPIILILAGNEGIHKSFDEFEFWPYPGTDYGAAVWRLKHRCLHFFSVEPILLKLAGTRACISLMRLKFSQKEPPITELAALESLKYPTYL